MSDLTPRQSQVLQVIRQQLHQTGMPPTRAEIAAQLGFRSANAAEEHLRALARKGCVELLPGSSRGIRLKDTMREQLGLPLVGRVAAGRPIMAEEHIVDHLNVDPALFQPRPHYLLKVVGMSMKDAGILDGDLVAVHRTAEVRNRQIVVARLENEVTVKRYRQQGSVVWLMPENASSNRSASICSMSRCSSRAWWSGYCGAAPSGRLWTCGAYAAAGRHRCHSPRSR
jgi:repressor LexA